MVTNKLQSKQTKETNIPPFEVNQAVIGLGLDDADHSVISYVDFLNTMIPMSAAFFLHVLPKFDLLMAMYEKDTSSLIGNYSLKEDIIKRMEDKIKSMLKTKDQSYIEYDVREGDPLQELLKSMDSFKADLLVIGQQKGKKHHGILAKNLARNTTGNALVIPQNAKPAISTILVPVDFSEHSAKALKTAIAIHKNLEEPCRIICLYVYSFNPLKQFRIDGPWIQTISHVENTIRDEFSSFLKKHAGEYTHLIETALVEKESSDTSKFILEYAEENGADFMVMGAKGHSKVRLLMLGSVTEAILEKEHQIPTLIVR